MNQPHHNYSSIAVIFMFNRRTKPNLNSTLRELIWPKMGPRRALTYWIHRISRIPDSIYAISAGIAFGASISFTPFVGLHFILAGLLAWVFRANIIASAIGTIVGNPWTFPIIWLWIYNLGVWMGFGTLDKEHSFQFSDLFGKILTALLTFDTTYLMKVAWPILSPMLAGAVPTSIIIWFGFYFLTKFVLKSVKGKRQP